MIRSLLITSVWLAQSVKAATTIMYDDTTGITNSAGNLITAYTLDVDLSGTESVVASYFMGGCLGGTGGGPIAVLGTPVVTGTSVSITNDVYDVITNLNGNGESLPTSGTGTTATAEYCITATLCNSDPAPPTGALCPVSNVVDFVRVDIDYEYTFDNDAIVIEDVTADPITPEEDSEVDDFTATAFGCSGTTELTSAVVEGDDFDVCVQIDTADESTVEITSITSITLNPEYGANEVFSSPTESTACGPGVTVCSATVTMEPRFVLNEDGVAGTRVVGGTVEAVFTLRQTRLRRRLRFGRSLLQTSRTFMVEVEPRDDSDDDCDFELTWDWFMDCLIKRIMNRIDSLARSAGNFFGFGF